MVILDTNVVSEPLRPAGEPKVLSWLNEQDIRTLYLTSITVAEIRFGLELLPASKRRQRLTADAESIIGLFGDRVLPFPMEATAPYARLRAAAIARGRAIANADAMIAAIAVHHNYKVATRDVAPFAAAGVGVINPWAL